MGSLFSAFVRPVPAGLALLAACALARPAAAELNVTVSRTLVGQYESVGITVKDPKQGLDAQQGPLLVTMADSGDHQHDLYLEPTGRPGEWSGRFTPMRTGRYTGTALLDRGDEKEIGLVPLIRVRRSGKSGFIRLNPKTRRALRYSNGASLFPIGVRLAPQDVRPGTDWRSLFGRLRASDINYVEVPVAWPAELPDAEQQSLYRSVDTAVVEAERTGRLAVQLRLMGPADLSEAGQTAYEAQLQRAARRWGYSPAVAAFYVASASPEVTPEVRQRWARAIRAVDPYRHLIALPGVSDDARAGGDILVMPWNWQRPANRFAILEVPEKVEGPDPLPGESSWQMLVLGGVGLPLWPYRVDAPDAPAVLDRIRKLARAAGRIPYQTAARPLTGVVSVDTPGSFCRYGRSCVGWVAPEGNRVLDLSALPRGHYRVTFWDAGQDVPVGAQRMWSTGSSARVELPQNLQAVFVQVEPTTAPPAAPRRAAKKAPRVVKVAAPAKAVAAFKPAKKRVVAKAVRKPKTAPKKVRKPTRAELRQAKASAAKKAAAKKAAASKLAARRAAARKAAAKKTAARKSAPKRATKKSGKTTRATKKPVKKAPVKKTVRTTTRKKRRS